MQILRFLLIAIFYLFSNNKTDRFIQSNIRHNEPIATSLLKTVLNIKKGFFLLKISIKKIKFLFI